MTQSFLALTMLLLCGCSAVARAGAGEIGESAQITEIGAFSNMRYTEEHAYGYTVMLWRADDRLFGFFESSAGLKQDTPIGELQNVAYDRHTGRLSFSAKLTMGQVSCGDSDGFVPSHDLFAFDGHLHESTVTGVVSHTTQCDVDSPEKDKVVMPASNAEAEFMHGPTTYGEWRKRWSGVLNFRGPKW